MPQSSGSSPNGTATGSTNVNETTSTSTDGHVSRIVGHSTTSNISDIPFNATVQPSTGGDGQHGLPGGVIALLLGLLVLGIGIFCLILYLKRTGKLYRMIPFKPLIQDRRSSTSSNHRPLDVDYRQRGDDDHNELDGLPQTREGHMFSIEDIDRDREDLDSQSRGTNDEYYYDEVFGKSVFEDEATNTSMRQLYLTSDLDDDEMFDIDAIVSSISGTKSTTPKT